MNYRRHRLLGLLSKFAQQLELPSLNPQLPLPISQEQNNAFDINSVDLSSVKPSLKDDIKKIIAYEIEHNPEKSPQKIIEYILEQYKEKNIDEFLESYISKIPELKADLPEAQQLTFPGLTPEIKFLPTKKEILEDKKRLDEAFDTKVREYEEKYQKFKEEHGREPRSFEIGDRPKLIETNNDQNYYSYRAEGTPTSKDVELNPDETLTQGQYKSYLDNLYNIYYKVEKNYKTLYTLQEELEKISTNKLPDVDPNTFSTYKELINDLKNRVIVGIQNMIKDSVGYSLFGVSTGKGSRYYKSTDFFNKNETEWFDNPEQMKAFLEEIPRFYDYRDSIRNKQYYHYSNPNDIKFWFDRKFNTMKDYNDALERAIKSFKKGAKFFKVIGAKLDQEIESALSGSFAFNLADYIEKGPHRQELNENYLVVKAKIEETSRILARTQSYYNHGMYRDNGHYNTLNGVDLGEMIQSSVPQYEMIKSLKMLIFSSINSIAKKIVDHEIGPAISEIAQKVVYMFGKEKFNLDLVHLLSGDLFLSSQDEDVVIEAFLNYAKEAGITTNFQSIIRYPKFIFHDEPEKIDFISRAMKDELYKIIINLFKKFKNELIVEISEKISRASDFQYTGLKSLEDYIVLTYKDYFFNKFSVYVNGVSLHDLDTAINSRFDYARYNKLKEIIKPFAKETIENYTDRPEDVMLSELVRGVLSHGYYNNEITKKDLITYYKTKFTDIYWQLRPFSILFPDGIDAFDIVLNAINFYFFDDSRIAEYKQLGKLPHIEKTKHLQEVFKQAKNKSMAPVENFNTPDDLLKHLNSLVDQFNNSIHNLLEAATAIKNATKNYNLEHNVEQFLTKRLQKFKGVGPHAIANKFEAISAENKELANFPFKKIIKILEEKTLKKLKEIGEESNQYDEGIDEILKFYYILPKNGESTPVATALSLIVNKFNINDPNEIINLYELLKYEISERNVSSEDVNHVFPIFITDVKSIKSQLQNAIKAANFIHLNTIGLSKKQLIEIVTNVNFKDLIKDVDIIEKFFLIYAKILSMGGIQKILSENKESIANMIKDKALPRGFSRRLHLIKNMFNSNTRISPSIEGFDSMRKLIEQTDYDLNALEKFATFKEYNDQIRSEKLYKDPQLFKLNWDRKDKNFRFRVLKTFDPYHFQVGVDTKCCQKLGGVGEAAAIDSYINPLAGVVILEALVAGSYKIISQSYFHYVPLDNGVILDNVETSYNENDFEEITGFDVDAAYALWARAKEQELKLAYFLCGKKYNKLSNDRFKKHSLKRDPRSFKYDEIYSDWERSSSLNLLRPSFELPEKIEEPKKQIKRERRKKAYLDILFST